MIPLVGRGPELELLRGELRRAERGDVRVILIAGEAGVGKSRLMAEAVASGADSMLVLAARSYRLGATAPFGLWLEAFDRHARSTGIGPITTHLKEAPQERLSRESILGGFTSHLDALCGDGPVLLALDDMDLADASSWEALRFVSRRLVERRLAIILTARPRRLRSNALAVDVLLALEDDGMLRRVNVRALNDAEVSELAAATLRVAGRNPVVGIPESLVRWLMERSRGHPLFAIGLLEALIAEGGDLSDPQLLHAPERLVERIGAELPRLDPGVREVLDVLGVMDRRTTPHELAAVMDCRIEGLTEPLERLCASGLAVENTTGSELTYEIAHPLVQDSVYQLIVGARRLTIHRSVARMLLDQGRWGAAAGHFARAAVVPDDESLQALCDAIRQAGSSGLYREALAVVGALLDVLPKGDTRWRNVFEAISPNADWVTDHLAEQGAELAIAAMHRIEEVFGEEEHVLERGQVRLYLAAFLAIGAGRLHAAEEACRTAIELFDRGADRASALLARNELVWISACEGDLARAVELGAAVLDEVDEGTDPAIEIQAAGSRAYALSLMGRFDESQAHYERAERRAKSTGNEYRRAWGGAQKSLLLALMGDLNGSERSLEGAFEIDYGPACDALGLERLAQCKWLQGDLDACVRLIDESGTRRSMRGSRRRAWGLAVAARALAEAGRLRRARRHLTWARETYGNSEILDWSAWYPWTAGFLARCDAAPDEALRAFDHATSRYRRMGAVAPEVLVQIDVVEAAMDARDRKSAEAAAARLDELAELVGGDLAPVLARLGRATHALMCHTPAVAAAEAAKTSLDRLGYRLLAAAAGYLEGISRDELGDDHALQVLEWAARICDECGAVWRRDRALAAISEHGVRGRQVVGSILGPASLTRREREVAELAARGFTARQIGERLYIGTRTVETHLARIYPKLGVASKRELVTKADTLGIAGRDP